MRVWLGVLVVFVGVSCGDSETQEVSINNPTASTPELLEYEDYSGQVTFDGTKGVFTSQRSGGIPLAYSFDTSRQERVQRLTAANDVEERFVTMTPDGAWIVFWQRNSAGSSLILRDWGGSNEKTLGLAPQDRVTSLSFVSDSNTLNGFIALSTKNSEGTKVHALPVILNAGQISFGVMSTWLGEEAVAFSGDKRLYTRQSKLTSKLLKSRVWDGSSWIESPNSLELTESAWKRGFPSNLGYFHPFIPKEKLTRTKSGLNAESESKENLNVGIADDIGFFDPSLSTTLNFNKDSFRNSQPISISSISATPSGDYLLLVGSDTYFCSANRVLTTAVMTLVRTSDMSTIPLVVARKTSDPRSMRLFKNPCAQLNEEDVFEFDASITKGVISQGGSSEFGILFESSVTGDREIRQVKFSVDWEKLEVNESIISDISANTRSKI